MFSARICSGAMYCGVPSMSPACVICICVARFSSRSLAIPKSSTRTTSRWRPRSCSITLSGLRSRWMIEWAWASVSAAETWIAIRRARPIGSGASRWITERSERPSMYSIAMNSVPSASWPKS